MGLNNNCVHIECVLYYVHLGGNGFLFLLTIVKINHNKFHCTISQKLEAVIFFFMKKNLTLLTVDLKDLKFEEG